MDMAFAAGPVFGDFASGWNSPEARRFRAYWLERLEGFGNLVLPVGAGRVLVSGTLFSKSFTFAAGLTKRSLTVMPFTFAAKEPGILHLALDVAFYKGVSVYYALQDASAKAREWLDRLDRETLINAIGSAAFDRLTAGGTVTQIVADVEIPPAWLTDP